MRQLSRPTTLTILDYLFRDPFAFSAMALRKLSRAVPCSLLLLANLAASSPLALESRQTCNTATNRQCWSSGFNINTDYETSWPNTGVTRTVSSLPGRLAEKQ